jgi:hypothetical protein
MKKIMTSIVILMLFIITLFPLTGIVFAGSEEDPEITDNVGDAFGYLDIDSVWFYEEEADPDFLFVVMKIHTSSYTKFQQTFAVFWEYQNKQYACGFHLGFGLGDEWETYDAGRYINRAPSGGRGYVHNISDCSYAVETGIITWKISKEIIGNPQRNDALTHTWSNAFRRLGLLGRIGFSRPILDSIVFKIFGNSLWDLAPDHYGEFGRDYVVQY